MPVFSYVAIQGFIETGEVPWFQGMYGRQQEGLLFVLIVVVW